jgi:extradiol dioxygenase family protein
MESQIRGRIHKSLMDFGFHAHQVALSPPVPPEAYQKILVKDQVHRVLQLMRHRGVDFTAEEWRRLCEADKIKALRKHGFPTASLLHGYPPDMLMKMGLLPMSDPQKRDDI